MKVFGFLLNPLFPFFTREGNWCLQKPLKLLLRPGGHGIIWKLAEERRIFDWLHSLGCTKALVRQVNNPMAAVDYGLSAFLGIGHEQNKIFGFASCRRRVNAQEGVNVLKMVHSPKGKRIVLTNVEYCDFKKFGIEDKPEKEGSLYSLFPSNTNILFVDLQAVQRAIQKMPSSRIVDQLSFGIPLRCRRRGQKRGRLRASNPPCKILQMHLRPLLKRLWRGIFPFYVTFNERRKTISTTKRKGVENHRLLETPEGCFYDFMQNAQELLDRYCGIKLISVDDESSFLQKGPSFLMRYHPALGPFYSIIKQKIQGGEIFNGSELQLEIADLEIKNLFLRGSLLILADRIMGHSDRAGHLVYSHQTGQCILKNVWIENEGIDWNGEDHLFWKHEIKRKASLTIHLKGHSRFEAENVLFKGNQTIEVPEGVHMTAVQVGEDLQFKTRPFEDQRPFWSYKTTSDESILLSR